MAHNIELSDWGFYSYFDDNNKFFSGNSIAEVEAKIAEASKPQSYKQYKAEAEAIAFDAIGIATFDVSIIKECYNRKDTTEECAEAITMAMDYDIEYFI